jgi:hypothetical protein
MPTYGVMLLDTSTFVSHITGRAFKKCIGHPYDLQFSQAQTIFHVDSETQELLLAWGEEGGGGGGGGGGGWDSDPAPAWWVLGQSEVLILPEGWWTPLTLDFRIATFPSRRT